MFEYIIQKKNLLFQFLGLELENFDYIATPQELQLWSAVKNNRLKTIKDLLLRQAFDIDDVIVKGVGHTLLHESVVMNRYELFKLALIYNANVDLTDDTGSTPLMKASALGRYDMV